MSHVTAYVVDTLWSAALQIRKKGNVRLDGTGEIGQ